MNLIILISLAVAAYGAPAKEECLVTDWKAWGPCEMTRSCGHPRLDYSYLAPSPSKEDIAHQRMVKAMKDKDEHLERARLQTRGYTSTLKDPARGAKCINGKAGSWPCDNIDMLSMLTTNELGYFPIIPGDKKYSNNDLWGWTDPLTGDEYVIHGTSGGTSFVRITPDPGNPQVVGFMFSHTVSSTWRDMKVINDHAFIVSEAEDHGMQVFDLTRLRELGHDPTRRFDPDTHYNMVGQSHNIVENPATEFVYIVGARYGPYPYNCNGGLHMVDVSDPKNPRFAGCFADDGYVHDAECVIYNGTDTRYIGKEICFCYNEDSLTIVDVTDKSNPTMLSREEYVGSYYAHQGWLTEDHTMAIMNDELDEKQGPNPYTRTLLWDVSDLTDPVLKNSYYSEFRSIDHNNYVLGDYVYQSNYRAGLQILKIDQAAYDLTRVAYFSVLQSTPYNEFGGTWSNYPYFKSGVIPVSSIEYGLFLVKPNWDQIKEEEKQGLTGMEIRERKIAKAKDTSECPSLIERRHCAVKKPTC